MFTSFSLYFKALKKRHTKKVQILHCFEANSKVQTSQFQYPCMLVISEGSYTYQKLAAQTHRCLHLQHKTLDPSPNKKNSCLFIIISNTTLIKDLVLQYKISLKKRNKVLILMSRFKTIYSFYSILLFFFNQQALKTFVNFTKLLVNKKVSFQLFSALIIYLYTK